MSTLDTVHWPIPETGTPPSDHLYGAAVWLLGRHPQLARLADRVPGVIDVDEDGPDIHLDALAEAIVEHDAVVVAWEEYGRKHLAPRDDRAYAAWEAAGPQRSAAASAIAVMSGSERSRLRLLATFSGTRVPLKVSDFQSLDAEGQELLADWCLAAQAA